jgi:assimilatory nitrate reductase catalytic subunit
MAPFQWGGASPFAARAFPTPDGKARLVSIVHAPRDDASRAYPLRLNTGRYRDQWHTMTRTGLSPKLSQHRREPMVEVHPDTAQRLGITDGALARVETPNGASIFRVAVTPDQRRRDLFVPIHWSDQTSAGGRAGLLPGQDRDPISGQPGFKNTPARAGSYKPNWTGFLVSRERPGIPDCAYWTRIRTAHGWLVELAGDGDPAAMTALMPKGERAEMIDARRGVVRLAVMADGQLQAALFVSRSVGLPPREWLIAQLGTDEASSFEVLAGRPATPAPDRGAIVCVCFDVGLNTLLAAIIDQRLVTVEAVGAALNAGTNCGSCRPAIANLLPAQESVHV